MPGSATAVALPDNEEILAELRRTAPERGMVLPDYGGYSICNVSQLALRNFGLENRCPEVLARLLERRYRKVVLIIMDALGWNQVHSWLDELPSLGRVYERGRSVPLTVTFPSTTTVALTALYTGLTPVEHTITGHNVYLREVGALMDVLRFSPYGDPRREVYAERGVDVHQLFPMITVFEPLKEAGLTGISITRGIFTNTALGWLHHVGAEVIGYLNSSDMFVHLRNAISREGPDGLITAYWDVVDALSHEYGPFSEMVRAAVDHFFYSLEREILDRLPPSVREETLLLITADHGQVNAPPEQGVFLSEEQRLRELLLFPPAGQSRAVYLYGGQGQDEALGRELRRFEDRLIVRTGEETLRDGLFGPPQLAERVRNRVGDFVAIGRDGAQVLGPEVDRGRLTLKGRHGSLTENEMLVPLLVLPMGSW